MIILPSHRELQKPVQTRQGDFAGDDNAPPDGWLDLRELNVKLVDALRAIAAHLSALLVVLFLWLVGRVYCFSARSSRDGFRGDHAKHALTLPDAFAYTLRSGVQIMPAISARF